jgi:hypothetical protein
VIGFESEVMNFAEGGVWDEKLLSHIDAYDILGRDFVQH